MSSHTNATTLSSQYNPYSPNMARARTSPLSNNGTSNFDGRDLTVNEAKPREGGGAEDAAAAGVGGLGEDAQAGEGFDGPLGGALGLRAAGLDDRDTPRCQQHGRGPEHHSLQVRSVGPAIEGGVSSGLGRGVVASYPIIDIKVEVLGGSFSEQDSDEVAFQIAAAMATGAIIGR